MSHFRALRISTVAALAGALALAGSASAVASTGLSVEVSAPKVTAYSVSYTETPVTLRITIAGDQPIVAWEVTVAAPAGTGVGYVYLFRSSDQPELSLAPGANDLPIGTNRSLQQPGEHPVTVTVTDATGAMATAKTTLGVTGRAEVSVEGVSGRLVKGTRSLIWGSASPEMRGRTVEVYFKPVGGKVKSLGTTRVAKSNGYWKLRASGLGPGTVKVKAKAPYIAGTWDTLKVTAKSYKATPPDFTKPRAFL
jgi:hypothetical protein